MEIQKNQFNSEQSMAAAAAAAALLTLRDALVDTAQHLRDELFELNHQERQAANQLADEALQKICENLKSRSLGMNPFLRAATCCMAGMRLA